MAKKDKKKVSKIKVKKKTWFKVVAPKIFGNKEIGESYLVDAEKAVGRKMKVNLRDLTGNFKDQNVYIGLQINKANGSILNTSVTGYQLTTAHVKRAIRKNTNRLDDFFTLKTKGGKNVILKSLVVTFGKTQRSTRSQIRKALGEYFSEEISKVSLDDFISNLVNHKLQIAAKRKLNKIYPLKEVSVRVLKLNEKGLVQEEIIVEDETVTKEVTEVTEAEKTDVVKEPEEITEEPVVEPTEETTEENAEAKA